MAQAFRVIISGQSLSGLPLADLRPRVGAAFALNDAQLDRMLCGKPVVIRRDLDEAGAQRLLASLLGVGLEARMEAVPAPAAEPAPPRPAPRSEPPRPSAPELFALNTPAPAPAATPAAAQTTPPRPAAPPPEDPFPTTARSAAELSIEETVICPGCGEVQPKRTLCRKCSLDMPRYRAAQAEREAEEKAARADEIAARAQARSGPASPLAASHDDSDVVAGIFGIGFAGRLDRLSFLNASLLSSLISYFGLMLMLKTGKPLAGVPFILLSFVYYFRCLALRLHDTERSGWLSLILLVPLLGALLALALLFIPGTPADNEYGPQPANSGKRMAIIFVLFAVSLVGFSKSLFGNPATVARLAQLQGQRAPAGPPPRVYAADNQIAIYTMGNCGGCLQMQHWLESRGLAYVERRVDQDQSAAARLQGLLAGSGKSQIQLPVLEVNGRLLADNPTPDDVHRHLR